MSWIGMLFQLHELSLTCSMDLFPQGQAASHPFHIETGKPAVRVYAYMAYGSPTKSMNGLPSSLRRFLMRHASNCATPSQVLAAAPHKQFHELSPMQMLKNLGHGNQYLTDARDEASHRMRVCEGGNIASPGKGIKKIFML